MLTPPEFKERLLKILSEKKWSKQKFAKELSSKLEIEEKSAYNYFNGKYLPRMENGQVIADMLGIPFFELFDISLTNNKFNSESGISYDEASKTMSVIAGTSVKVNVYPTNYADKPTTTINMFFEKRLSIVNPYPLTTHINKDYSYIDEVDRYVVIGGNIFHENPNHPFGFKNDFKDGFVSLYDVVERCSDSGEYQYLKMHIADLLKTYRRQRDYYGVIGKLSESSFCWAVFFAGYLSKIQETM